MPEIRFPSLDFTVDEKAETKRYINSCLRRCAALLDDDQADRYQARHDAHGVVSDALSLAKDPDACESPPLAKCNLYLGHVLRAMKKYGEARNAYLEASKSPTYDSVDRAASQQAAEFASEMEQKVRDRKRKGGIWSAGYHGASPRAVRFHHLGAHRQGVQLETAALQPPCTPKPEVHRTGSVVRKPTVHHLSHQISRPHMLIKSNGGWAAEAISTPKEERLQRGRSRRVQDPSNTHGEDHLAMDIKSKQHL
ncbi:hypothetical protein AAE478_005073 [Parahypoxylon ruwenzoriense]